MKVNEPLSQLTECENRQYACTVATNDEGMHTKYGSKSNDILSLTLSLAQDSSGSY